MNTSARILMLDIETAPAKVYTFQLRDVTINIEAVIQDSYMLSWSAKWHSEKKVMSDALINYPSVFKKDKTDEHMIAKSIWKLLDETDIVVAHNGDRFDIKWLNDVFLRNGMKPPSSYKTIDTLKESTGNFYSISHRLNYLCQRLGIGHKLKHEGFAMWPKCMRGDKQAWKCMMKYNKLDVTLLEELYDLIKPFMKNHPNLALYSELDTTICPICSGTEFRSKGFSYTSTNKYRRYVCKNCGKNVRDRQGLINQKNGAHIRNTKG